MGYRSRRKVSKLPVRSACFIWRALAIAVTAKGGTVFSASLDIISRWSCSRFVASPGSWPEIQKSIHAPRAYTSLTSPQAALALYCSMAAQPGCSSRFSRDPALCTALM